MKKAPLRKVIIFIFSVVLLSIPSMIHAQSKGQILMVPQLFFGSGFTVDPELMPGAKMDPLLFPQEEFTKTGAATALESGPKDKDRRDDASWNVFKYRHMKIFISHIETEQNATDGRHTQGDKITKFSQIISLPTTLFTSPYKDSMETVGKIFEPQINLGIEF